MWRSASWPRQPKAAYQMLIAVNLTQNTYHMVEYQRFPVKEPDPEGRFDELIEFEMEAVHPDYREEFRSKFTRKALTEAFQRENAFCPWMFPT